MTKALKELFKRLSGLPEEVQDMTARQLSRQLEEEPEPGDRDAIKEGMAEFARGEYVTLDQWRHEMGLDAE